MNKKILQICTPPLTSYPGFACQLSIALCIPNAYYIQLCTVKWINEKGVYIVFHNNQDLTDVSSSIYCTAGNSYCPFLHIHNIPYDENLNLYSSIEELIVNAISNGYYLYMSADVSFIKAYNHSSSLAHEFIIHGYDLDQKIFYICDFINTKYQSFECSFVEMHKAYTSLILEYVDMQYDMGCFLRGINFIHPYTAISTYDQMAIKTQIHDYLFLQNMYLNYNYLVKNDMNWENYWGNSCYDIFSEYLFLIFSKNELFIDNRNFHVYTTIKSLCLNG